MSDLESGGILLTHRTCGAILAAAGPLGLAGYAAYQFAKDAAASDGEPFVFSDELLENYGDRKKLMVALMTLALLDIIPADDIDFELYVKAPGQEWLGADEEDEVESE